jgi:hypothetical protein
MLPSSGMCVGVGGGGGGKTPEDRNRSSFETSCFLSPRIPDDEKVQKPSNSDCDTPSSEPFRIYLYPLLLTIHTTKIKIYFPVAFAYLIGIDVHYLLIKFIIRYRNIFSYTQRILLMKFRNRKSNKLAIEKWTSNTDRLRSQIAIELESYSYNPLLQHNSQHTARNYYSSGIIIYPQYRKLFSIRVE